MSWRFLIVLVGSFSFPVFAQVPATSGEQCSLELKDSPVILGLKLGMAPSESSSAIGRTVTARDIRSRIKITKTRPDGPSEISEKSTRIPIGETEFSYYPRADTNVGSIYLRYWKDKLFTVLLDFYERDVVADASLTTAALAKRLGLPSVGWKNNELICKEFYVRAVRHQKSIQVELTDSALKNEIKKAAEASITRDGYLLSEPGSNTIDGRPVLLRRDGQSKAPRPK